ncbi:SecY-interacting protein Syd [Priestia sp. YIM B13486]|uniref:SecY-interacting protein Syd n=1 Tax=Priestia sp. YIM B13486 TaxID=3366304 RepID=UPI003671E72E
MSVKGTMTDYFEGLLDYWNEKYNTFPKAPWDGDINPLLYLSEPDEEEYIFWKPVEKKDVESFSAIETEIRMPLHHSIKDYFNSYLFLSLEGLYHSNYIYLEPVEPDKDLLSYFKNLKNYEESQGKGFRYVQIGFISPDEMAINVDNETGKIYIEDYETNELKLLASSLEELIGEIKLKK